MWHIGLQIAQPQPYFCCMHQIAQSQPCFCCMHLSPPLTPPWHYRKEPDRSEGECPILSDLMHLEPLPKHASNQLLRSRIINLEAMLLKASPLALWC